MESIKIPYRRKVSFEERKAVSSQLMERKPNYVPFIVESEESSNAVMLKKERFFVNKNTQIADFISILLESYIISPDIQLEHVFLKVQTPSGSINPRPDDALGDLYDMYKEEDGFLYVTVYKERTFGN
ncbi:Autophagy-related protein [Entamoeba marina]